MLGPRQPLLPLGAAPGPCYSRTAWTRSVRSEGGVELGIGLKLPIINSLFPLLVPDVGNLFSLGY